jgi:signal transduction histidine kinase
MVNWRRLSLVPYRVRLLLRAVFVFLMMATVGLALSVLQQEKQLSYKNYQTNFQKTREQIAATLRHPSGQLALLNPSAVSGAALHPLLLPFAALDFDDLQKVQQAVAMSGCLAQYGSNGSLCVGIGNNPWAGGFVYVAGTFDSALLVPHTRGDQVLDGAHRVHVKVALRGQVYEWIAPFEESAEPQTPASRFGGMRGRLTGFTAADVARAKAPAVKDFRGWIWQNPHCNQPSLMDDSGCARSAFFSLRLPIGVLQEALFEKRRPVWPPEDLNRINVSIAVLAPGDGAPLLDSDKGPSAPAFSLADLKPMLLPGESLQIRRMGDDDPRAGDMPQLIGAVDPEDQSWHIVTTLIRHLPVDAYDVPLAAKEIITTPAGSYEVLLKGDVRSVSKSLSVVASRLTWFVGAMLAALALAWLVIEIGIIRRIKVLIKRADDVGDRVRTARGFSESALADLRGDDELGVLATGLHDLLRRVREDVERENIRAEQERDMWHAVGHEIMSPLQSLMVLHGSAEDQSLRYINRMQQAIRVLYGRASPSEAFQSSELQVGEIDLTAFLRHVADNAPCIGIGDVLFQGTNEPLLGRADEYSLEDVVTHVLRNAERYRPPASPITITLEAGDIGITITIHNQGPPIAPDMLGKIFEYGVSDQAESGANGNRGQGLFVAKTYMAKMGGTITAHNRDDGVSFLMSLRRAG